MVHTNFLVTDNIIFWIICGQTAVGVVMLSTKFREFCENFARCDSPAGRARPPAPPGSTRRSPPWWSSGRYQTGNMGSWDIYLFSVRWWKHVLLYGNWLVIETEHNLPALLYTKRRCVTNYWRPTSRQYVTTLHYTRQRTPDANKPNAITLISFTATWLKT